MVAAIDYTSGDEVGDDIDTAAQHLGHDARVIGAEVMLLSIRDIEVSPGLEEELDHLDIGRQCSGTHGDDIVELGVVAEDTCGERLEEATLELAPGCGLAQTQRGEDVQADLRVAHGPAIELVDERVRFAECQRQRQDDAATEPAQRGIDAFADVVEELRHRARLDSITRRDCVTEPR